MSRCDIIDLQEVRRGGQGSFEAVVYTVYSSGSKKGGKHGVGLAVAKHIVEASGTYGIHQRTSVQRAVEPHEKV